jgi:ATP-dependent helicase/nuclease subunit A
VREALTLLASLHRDRNRRPVADTISTLLDRTRAHVGFVLRPGGEQALANVLHVAELARQYEAEGGMSFRGFVETLQAEAATRQAAEAPDP